MFCNPGSGGVGGRREGEGGAEKEGSSKERKEKGKNRQGEGGQGDKKSRSSNGQKLSLITNTGAAYNAIDDLLDPFPVRSWPFLPLGRLHPQAPPPIKSWPSSSEASAGSGI